MHFFLYEWCTGGGLVNEPGALPASLVRDGATMAGALAADLTRISGARVTALRDPRVVQLALHGSEIVDIQSAASHFDEFERLAASADATIVIAPEFDGILLKTARRVIDCGGKLVSPSPEFIAVTANKHRTCQRLAAAGVQVPDGIVVDSDQKLPADRPYPAVLKPVDGAGSQDNWLVAAATDDPPPYAWPRRLERFVTGMPVSVAFLGGPAGRMPLVPCRQRISDDGRLRYRGGELPLAAGLADRAMTLADRALAARPTATGYVGVDLVLGSDPAGGEDVVIEVNPRLTTSYIGLRAAATTNLAESMVQVARGEVVSLAFSDRPLEFDVAGNVSFLS
jgi:tyramine---L-glutamate ligase